MGQGLQTFDAAGNVVLDSSKLVMKRVISVPVTVSGTAANNVALTIPPSNTVIGVAVAPVSTGADTIQIEADVVGSTLTWRARNNDGKNYRLDVMLV